MLPRGGSMSSPEEVQGFPSQRMPSLFAPDETDYDRYAACLAATESLRRLRDKSTAESKQLSGTEATDEQKRIRAEYIINSSKVLKALGMSVSQFNQVGRQVNQDESLKEKVSCRLKYLCASEWRASSNFFRFSGDGTGVPLPYVGISSHGSRSIGGRSRC